jgi:hypothetical protein
LLAALNRSRVLVVPFVVNNNPETSDRGRRFFPTAAGWCFARAKRSRTNAGSRRFRVPGAAQHEAQRNGALQTRDRSSPWRSRISDAPLRCARAASHPGHTSLGRARTLFTFQTAHLVPAARFLRPGFCIVASLTRIEGWAERRETFGCVRGTRGTCRIAARQALARRLASHDAGRSPLGAPPWRF